MNKTPPNLKSRPAIGSTEIRRIANESDIALMVVQAISFAKNLGFKPVQATEVATAISELATNITKYAGSGTVSMQAIVEGRKHGIEVRVEDRGPGIADIEQALQEHFSTKQTLGLGLPGTRRLTDEFQIESELGRGTRILFRKWIR